MRYLFLNSIDSTGNEKYTFNNIGKQNKSNKTNNGSFGWRVWKTYAKNKRFTLIKLNHFLRAHNYYYKFMRKIKLSILKWYQLLPPFTSLNKDFDG